MDNQQGPEPAETVPGWIQGRPGTAQHVGELQHKPTTAKDPASREQPDVPVSYENWWEIRLGNEYYQRQPGDGGFR